MRWIVRICVALVALVVVAVGLLFMLPTDRIGQLASDQLKKQTGRTLTLAGDFFANFIPYTRCENRQNYDIQCGLGQ